jgi:pre-mRNA-processing factor 6
MCACVCVAGAFAGGIYDQDDKEADQIWDAVDQFMDERRRVSNLKTQQNRSRARYTHISIYPGNMA